MRDQLRLLFALETLDADVSTAVASLVRELNDDRNWSCGEVEFVNEMDESSASQAGDEPIWTLGGVLTLTRPAKALDFHRS